MKKFLQEKSKIIFLCLFIVMTCTACSNPRGTDGKTKVDEIIASEKIEVKKSLVNVTEIEDKKLSNEAFVAILYKGIMDREPDADGLKAWTAVLDKGESRYHVYEGFVYSKEFTELLSKYGL